MYFISGVSGVGKTAVMEHLKPLLSSAYEIHDFDERGVPDNAGRQWRLDETQYWIMLGGRKAEENMTLVVCGFANPDEIAQMLKAVPTARVKTILLDGDASIIEQRLRDRNQNAVTRADLERAAGPAEEFIENNTRFVPILREICERHNCPIIDTSHLDPKSVAEKVAELINMNA